MNNLQKSLLMMLGVGVAVCAAPVAGAVIGASVASSAVIGGIAGFAIGALALPLPIAFMQTSGKPTGAEKDKNRLQRMGSVIAGMYCVVGMAVAGIVTSPFKRKSYNSTRQPIVLLPRETPVTDAGKNAAKIAQDFDAVAQSGAAPAATPAKPAAQPAAPKP